MGKNDPYRTNPQFQKALTEVIPQIEAGLRAGKTANQLFLPKINGKDNPDYVRPVTQAPSLATLNRQNTRTFGTGTTTAINTQADMEKAYLEGRLTPEAAAKLIKEKGWTRNTGPSVPLPN